MVFQIFCHLWSFAFAVFSLWNAFSLCIRKISVPPSNFSLRNLFSCKIVSLISPSGIKIAYPSFLFHPTQERASVWHIALRWSTCIPHQNVSTLRPGILSYLSEFPGLTHFQAHRLSVRTYWCRNERTQNLHSVYKTASQKLSLNLKRGMKNNFVSWCCLVCK